MALSLVTAPTTEPLTVEEAKAQCRVDVDTEWELFESLIVSAREYVESFTHRAMIYQEWDLKLDAFPCEIWVPLPPLRVVAASVGVNASPVISYTDSTGTTTTLATTLYTVDAPAGPLARMARIVPAYGLTWPTTRDVPNAVNVRFTAGYGALANDVPARIKAAMKALVEHWWRNRDAGESVPDGVNALLWSYKAF